MESERRRHAKAAPCRCCDVDIRIENQGDVNIYNCTEERGGKEQARAVDGADQRAERAGGLVLSDLSSVSERQRESFEDAFVDYLSRAWDKFKEELVGGAGAVIKALGILKGAIAIAIAALLALAVIAIVARWAPADLIMDDAIGYSVVELAELTNANVPAPVFGEFESPQGLKASLNPLEKGALTYREFREYHSEEEESRYDLFLRYNRIA